MPVYEYACKACGNHLEVSQSFKDEPLTTCPVCGGPLRKVFNSIGIVLKGSGFYRTDSRLPAKKSEKSEASEKSGESGDKAGEKSGGEKSSGEKAGGDKAPAAKSETKSSDAAKSKTA